MRELHENSEDMTPLFQAIIDHVPAPKISDVPYFQMLVSNLDYSDYLGRIALGRIVSGRVAVGESIVCINREGRRERANVTGIFTFAGMGRVEVKHASAGDIIGLTAFEEVYIGETLTDREERTPLQFVDIDPPTIRMRILVNDSPFAGREGKFVTARHVRERLVRETRGNVSLQVKDTEAAGAFEINARGEMQIAILVEQMRREGYEVMVSRPEVIFQARRQRQLARADRESLRRSAERKSRRRPAIDGRSERRGRGDGSPRHACFGRGDHSDPRLDRFRERSG